MDCCFRAESVAIIDARSANGASNNQVPLTDKFGRHITDLRVSITNRCNFRCVYCRSAKPESHIEDGTLLEFSEYERLVKILLGMGIRKVRITGGEPLVRAGVVEFIARLKSLGVPDLSMTTNGHLLAERCDRLVAAGLNRINISLDSLDPEKFARITRTESFSQVMAGPDFKPARTWGEVVEDRGSQVTFSALGQEAPIEAKEKWDPDFSKRKQMKVLLDKLIPEFSVRLGGTTSIDITKPGIDKAYGIRKLRDTLGIAIPDMIYVGDALFPGGNDYPAKDAGVLCIQVRDPEESKRVIETIVACLAGEARP